MAIPRLQEAIPGQYSLILFAFPIAASAQTPIEVSRPDVKAAPLGATVTVHLTLEPGIVVVFARGTPTDINSAVVTASGALALDDSRGKVKLNDASGERVDGATWNREFSDEQFVSAPGTYQFHLRQDDLDRASSYSFPRSVEIKMDGAFLMRLSGPNPLRTRTVFDLQVRETQPVQLSRLLLC